MHAPVDQADIATAKPHDRGDDPPTEPATHATRPASLPRRLGALLYDGLLVLGIWMSLTFVLVIARNTRVEPALEFALLLGCAVLFCTYFWVAHGRTLGMQAWRLRLLNRDGGRVSIAQSLVRFTVLLPGVLLLQGGAYFPVLIVLGLLYFQAGYVWALFDPEGQTWADRLSQTRMVQLRAHSADAPPQPDGKP